MESVKNFIQESFETIVHSAITSSIIGLTAGYHVSSWLFTSAASDIGIVAVTYPGLCMGLSENPKSTVIGSIIGFSLPFVKTYYCPNNPIANMVDLISDQLPEAVSVQVVDNENQTVRHEQIYNDGRWLPISGLVIATGMGLFVCYQLNKMNNHKITTDKLTMMILVAKRFSKLNNSFIDTHVLTSYNTFIKTYMKECITYTGNIELLSMLKK